MDIWNTIPIEIVNIHYWNRYKQFIQYIKDKGYRCLEYSENHHIIPKSINKSLVSNKFNIIKLTAREHFIAHKILIHCFKSNTKYYTKMLSALFLMVSKSKQKLKINGVVITSKLYERVRLLYSSANKGPNNGNYGNRSKYMTNGTANKMVKYKDINLYLSKGWYFGRSVSENSTPKDTVWVHNNTNSKMIKFKDLNNFFSINYDYEIGRKSMSPNTPIYVIKNIIKDCFNKYDKGLIPFQYLLHFYIWVNDGTNNYTVDLIGLDEYLNEGMFLGTVQVNNRNKTSKNRVAINKDNKTKFVIKKDLSKYINKGWNLGLSHSSGEKIKGKVCVNNGINQLFICKQDVDKYLNDGYTLGTLHKGKFMFVNDGIKTIKIYKKELPIYLKKGFKIGRHSNNSTKNKIFITNGKNNRLINKEELDIYISKGFKRGMTRKNKTNI